MQCLIAAFLMAVPPAGAANLTGVSVGAVGGRLALDAPARFRAFRLSAPERFVVDLEGTGIAIPERTWAGAGGIIRMRAAPWGEDSSVLRVVFDLSGPMQGIAREAAGAVVVEFIPVKTHAPAPVLDPEPEALDLRDALSPLAIPLAVPVLRMPPPRAALATLVAVRSGPDRAVISLDRTVEPNIFMASEPPRLVIDLPGTRHSAAAAAVPRPGGVLLGVRSAPFKTGPKPVTRVVLDLARPAQYSVDKSGSEIIVTFEPASTPRRAPVSRTREWRGWIVDGSGRPQNGVFLVRFSLPDEGGLSAPRWTESLYVDARGGRFSAVLGRFSQLPSDAVEAGVPLDAAPPPGVSWRILPR